MIPHVSIEDARRWAADLKCDAEFIESSLANGKTQNGRLLFLALRLHLEEAAYCRVMSDTAGAHKRFGQALERFAVLTSAEDVEPEWLRQGLEDAMQVAIVLGDDSHVTSALAAAKRLMNVDKDVRDYFVAAEACLYHGDRQAAAHCAGQAWEEKGRYSFGLLDALRGAIDRNAELFVQGLTKSLKAFDSEAASSGCGSTTAVTFLRGAALLALNRRVNTDLVLPVFNDERLLPGFA